MANYMNDILCFIIFCSKDSESNYEMKEFNDIVYLRNKFTYVHSNNDHIRNYDGANEKAVYYDKLFDYYINSNKVKFNIPTCFDSS